MFLSFIHIVCKFLGGMMCFDRPTSIITFGGKSEKLCLKFKEPLRINAFFILLHIIGVITMYVGR